MFGFWNKLKKNRKALIELNKFKALNKAGSRFDIDEKNTIYLDEKTVETDFDHHYVYHPAWAARVLAKTKPAKHVDIASTLHFSSMVSAFINTEFYDIRPAKLSLSGISTHKADLMKLPFESNSIKSLSCMHSVEHVGLGRYDDLLDPDADLIAIEELKRVTSPGGDLLFVVPIGKPRIVFNAHRIYSYDQILSYFKGFKLEEFALIPDSDENGGLIYGASKKLTDAQNYGCGCFWFKK